MLTHLSIRNFILIRELEMDFHDGFTVITGETGAGKSIFLGALGLILGERADIASVSDPSSKCVVEGTFNIQNVIEPAFFEEHELDYEDVCIIRREILPQGKSRAFVNDTPVGLHILKQLSEKLIDVHSQHSTYLLAHSAFHLSLLDAAAGTNNLYNTYLKNWEVYRKTQSTLEELKSELSKKEKDIDYYSFLLAEIDELNTYSGENEELEHQILVLQHSEKIKSVLSEVSGQLKNDDNDIHGRLIHLVSLLNTITSVFPDISDIPERLRSAAIELDDIASEISSLESSVLSDPSMLFTVENRMNNIQRLLHKHKVVHSSELLSLKEDFAQKLNDIEISNDAIISLEKQSEHEYSELQTLAEELSYQRQQIIPQLEKKITEILSTLAMPHAVFNVSHFQENLLSARGLDKVSFLFSSNKGEEPQELSKVASGGEMSRVMLALKSVIAESSMLPTLIFDEIDSGISGETAKKMAGIFTEMGKKIQLIVISHLPQIAAKAQSHMLVSKRIENNATITTMALLENNQRAVEISKMLGGDKYSDAAYNTALEMLNES